VHIFRVQVTVAFNLYFVFDARIANRKRKIKAYLKPLEGLGADAICRSMIHSDIIMLCMICFIMWLFLFLILYLIGNNRINQKNVPILAKLLNSVSQFSLPLLMRYLCLLL